MHIARKGSGRMQQSWPIGSSGFRTEYPRGRKIKLEGIYHRAWHTGTRPMATISILLVYVAVEKGPITVQPSRAYFQRLETLRSG